MRLIALQAALIAAGFLTGAASAAELKVRVSGIAERNGQIGCALYAKADAGAFPMDNRAVRTQWLPADPGGVTCVFADVAPGPYAVSASHDLNGNRKVDTSFLGIPVEPWGVSKNARPALRPPRFDEAEFVVPENTPEFTIDVTVAK